MTSAPSSGDAVLALARELRHAVGARHDSMHDAIHAYNHAGGHRLDYAAAFLKTVQRADSTYEDTSSEALKTYRERIEAG
jgi:hypothetical protein